MLTLIDQPTATHTIRSTETRQQCWMEWLLDKLYTGEEGRGYFATGTALHKGYELLIQGWPYDVVEELVLDMVEEEIRLTDENGAGMMWTKGRPEDKWEEDTTRLLKSWYDEAYPDYADIDVSTEYWLETDTKDFSLKTQVDLLVLEDPSWFTIVDWKTGANKGSDDRQLHVYWWALKRMGIAGKDDPMQAMFYYVHHNEWVEPKMPYPGDDYIYDMIATAEQRRREGPYTYEPSWKCKFCQYTDVCPAWADNESLEYPALKELAMTLNFSGVNE